MIQPLVVDGGSTSVFARRPSGDLDEGVCTIFGCWTSGRKAVRPLWKHDVAHVPGRFRRFKNRRTSSGAPPNQQIIPAAVVFAFWTSGLSRRVRLCFPRRQRNPHDKLMTSPTVVGEEYLLGDTEVSGLAKDRRRQT
jgi:hypothetical protein